MERDTEGEAKLAAERLERSLEHAGVRGLGGARVRVHHLGGRVTMVLTPEEAAALGLALDLYALGSRAISRGLDALSGAARKLGGR